MNIAVLLNGPVKHDSRVIKVIRSLATAHNVDLFYIDGSGDDRHIFPGNVRLFSYEHPIDFRVKLKRHSFFYREFSFFVNHVLREHRLRNYDLIYANDLPCLWPAVKIKEKSGVRVLYDSHEIYLETLNQFLPLGSDSLIKRLFAVMLLRVMFALGEKAERELIKKSDEIITVNQSLAEYFRRKYKLKEVSFLLNCPYLADEKEAEPLNFREKYNWKQEDFIVYHHGNFTRGKGLEHLLDAMARLEDNYKLVLVGAGTLTSVLKQRAGREDLKGRVVFPGRIPPSQLAVYASGADIGINFLENINLSKKLASNNKLFEYIHAALPVLSSNNIENIRVHERFKVGEITKLDPGEIAKKIKFMNEVSKLTAYRQACLRAREELNWNKQEKILLGRIKVLDKKG